MKRFSYTILAVVCLCTACHTSLDERILKETNEYTRKECPKRLDNFTVLDSLTYTYCDTLREHTCYYTLQDLLDNDSVYTGELVDYFAENVLKDIRTNLQYRRLREHAVTFTYRYYSATQNGHELLRLSFTPEDYK